MLLEKFMGCFGGWQLWDLVASKIGCLGVGWGWRAGIFLSHEVECINAGYGESVVAKKFCGNYIYFAQVVPGPV